MLIDLILTVVIGILNVLMSIVPDITLNADFINGFESVAYLMGLMAYVVPMKVFLGCLSVFFMLQNVSFMIMIANWLIRKIPSIN